MNRHTYTQIVLLLIIWIYAAVDTKRCIRPRIQLWIQSGIFSDSEQVQGLGIYPDPVDMQVFDAFRHNIVPDRQVSAPKERTAFHDVGIEDRRIAEISALFQKRRSSAGVGNMG